MVEGAVGGGRRGDTETRAPGAAAPLCFPVAPTVAQRPSWDDVLFPGDRAGHQRSLHLFIFLNISYFERMINNKESESGMGTSLLVFLGRRGCLCGLGVLPWQGSREGRGAQTGCSRLHGAGSAPASTQGCSPGDKRAVSEFPSHNRRRTLGVDTAPPVQLLPMWLTHMLKIHRQQELLRPPAFSPDAQDVNRHL